jgi:uncharacterized membrane protein (Fun14 family)
MVFDLGFIAASTISGGLAGFLIGYAIKKAIKIIFTIIGLFLAGLAYLNYQGLVSVDWDKVGSISNGALIELSNSTQQYVPAAIDNQVMPTLLNFGLPLGGSFAAGFTIGCLKG